MELLTVIFVLLFTITTAHEHEIIFLVDNSFILTQKECILQQAGLSNYFAEYHNRNAGNVLSYYSFNTVSINKLITFNGNQYDNNVLNELVFNNLINTIKNFDCNVNAITNINNNYNDQNTLNIIKQTISLFSQNTHKTPHLLLVNNFPVANDLEIEICDYFDNNQKHLISPNGAEVRITLINILGNGIMNNYLYCLKDIDDTSINNYFEFNNPSEQTFLYHEQVVIDSVCDSESGSGSSSKEGIISVQRNAPFEKRWKRFKYRSEVNDKLKDLEDNVDDNKEIFMISIPHEIIIGSSGFIIMFLMISVWIWLWKYDIDRNVL